MSSRKRMKRGGDGGSYYSHLRRRVVRQPTDVLYDMISKYVHQVHDKKLAHDICERCTAYPDDVNFLYNYNPRTPLSCLLQERRNRDKVAHNMFFQLIVSTIINSDSFRVFDEVRLNNRNKCFLKYFSKENRQRFNEKVKMMQPKEIADILKPMNLETDTAVIIIEFMYGVSEADAKNNFFLKQRVND